MTDNRSPFGEPALVVGRVSRSLTVAASVSVVVVISVPLISRFAYGYWNGWIIGIALVMVVPVTAIAWLTIWQERHRSAPTSFASRPLVVAVYAVSFGGLALSCLGYLGVFIDLILVPLAAASLALSWVQPRGWNAVATTCAGVALVPFTAWFAGRADEYASEGTVAGAIIVALVGVLVLLRRRGRLAGLE